MASGPAKGTVNDWQAVPASDWQDVNAAPAQPEAPEPTMLQKAMTGAKDVGAGMLKGAGSTANAVGSMLVPDRLVKAFGGTVPTQEQKEGYFAPTNTAQAIGKGVEQAGEFLLPGGAEEHGATALAKFVPKAVGRVIAGGVGSGVVNKAQGGSFGAGAALGAVGGAIGEGVRTIAPSIAESALNIRKLDRAFGKTPGRAILDETKGFAPGSVADSAQGVLNDLNPQLNAAADRASVRANNPRGLLPAPAEEIPLHSSPDVPGTPTRTVAMHQPGRSGRLALPAPRAEVPMSSHADIFPDQLPSGHTGIPLGEAGESSAMGRGQYFGQIPGERGGPGQVQGTLIRPFEAGSGEIPSTLPNRSASLSPAKGAIKKAFSTAERQGERSTTGQLEPMARHLDETIAGEPIGNDVTPRQFLDLKRGFGNEFIHRWNPDTMQGVKGTAAQAYHQMGQEFNRVVPEGAELNRRISNLIPVAKRAESAELNAPTGQRILNRFGAHTGALAGGLFGANEGYQQGGATGAILGGLAGIAIPEMVASPTGQMALARTLNSSAVPKLSKVFTGAALQLPKPDEDDSKKKRNGE